jgi:hypothetical protein
MKEEIKQLQSKILKEYEDNPRAYHTDTFEKWLCEKIEQTYKQGYGQGVIDGEKRQKEMIDKVNDVFKQ